jgi:hypothetical protein
MLRTIAYVGILTRLRRVIAGVALRGGLTAVYFSRLGDLAIAVDDRGAFLECDGLAGLALSGIGLCFGHVSVALRHAVCDVVAFVVPKLWGGTMYFAHNVGSTVGGRRTVSAMIAVVDMFVACADRFVVLSVAASSVPVIGRR